MPDTFLPLLAWGYAATMAALGVAGLLLPMLRVRRAGQEPLAVAHGGSLGERLAGATLSLAVSATALWSVPLTAWPLAMPGSWPTPLPVRSAGLLLAAGGVLLVVTAQRQMGAHWRLGVDRAPDAFVHSGLFASIRHPIYTGFACVFAGAVAVVSAWPALVVSGVGACCLLVMARFEEAALLAQFGAPYQAYLDRTGRFLPRLKGRQTKPA